MNRATFLKALAALGLAPTVGRGAPAAEPAPAAVPPPVPAPKPRRSPGGAWVQIDDGPRLPVWSYSFAFDRDVEFRFFPGDMARTPRPGPARATLRVELPGEAAPFLPDPDAEKMRVRVGRETSLVGELPEAYLTEGRVDTDPREPMRVFLVFEAPAAVRFAETLP